MSAESLWNPFDTNKNYSMIHTWQIAGIDDSLIQAAQYTTLNFPLQEETVLPPEGLPAENERKNETPIVQYEQSERHSTSYTG